MSKLIKLLLAAFLLRAVFAFPTWHPDVNNHIDWGIRFWQYGPGEFYQANVWSFTWPNQPPGTIYIFAAARKLFEFVFSLFWWVNVNVPPFPSNLMFFFETNLYPALLKLPAILADLGIAYLIYSFFKEKKKEKVGFFGAALFLLNPVIWYNSAVWGQTDATVNFLALLGFFLLFKRRLSLAVLSFLASLYIKASLLIFAPAFVIVVLRQRYSLGNYLKAGIFSLLLLGVLTLPFSGGEPFGWLFELYKDKVFKEQLQIITANAFNIWAALTGIHEQPHSQFLGPLTYRAWGILFFGLSFIPAIYLVWRKQDYKSVFWSLAVTSFAAFMLLTNMHERYLYPFFPVFTVLATENRKLLPLYVGISGINIVNLYNFWWVPRIEAFVRVLAAGNRLLPRLLGLLNFGLFLYFYSKFLQKFKLLRLKTR